MATWAKIEGGHAYEIVVGDTIDAALDGKRHPDWIAANKARYAKVPDGTEHGATSNGDGTFAKPAVAAEAVAVDTPSLEDLSAKLDAIAAKLDGK